MNHLGFRISFLTLLLTASFALSCGTGQQGAGTLQAITVSPAAAAAFEVQFTATGHYVNPSHTVSPQPAQWVACQKGLPTTDVTVSNSGLAQCSSGFTGAYSINAYDMTNCNLLTACGGGCTVVGSAQLSCVGAVE